MFRKNFGEYSRDFNEVLHFGAVCNAILVVEFWRLHTCSGRTPKLANITAYLVLRDEHHKLNLGYVLRERESVLNQFQQSDAG